MRKTSSYLHQLRMNVDREKNLLDALAADLEQQTFELCRYTVEDIRYDLADEFNTKASAVDKVRLEYGKQLKKLQKAVNKYREFF